MPDTRHQDLIEFVRLHLGSDAGDPQPASSDASFRRYWRVGAQGQNHIVMDAPPEKESCVAFIDVARRLADADLRAPRVLAEDQQQGFLLLSDLGTETLLQALDQRTADSYYRSAMDSLQRMQRQVDGSGLPRYDTLKLRDEMELMPRWFLRSHLALEPDCEEFDIIEGAFVALIHNARVQPQVFVHRDYHSRNLMLGAEVEDPLGILDFQDAVIGPLTYDLVSLLKDCYVRWEPDRVARWAEDYRQRLAGSGMEVPDPRRWQRWFDLMGVQRHLKVLGIFARLYYRDGKAGYLGDLPRVLEYVLESCERYLELEALGKRLQRWTQGRDLTIARA